MNSYLSRQLVAGLFNAGFTTCPCVNFSNMKGAEVIISPPTHTEKSAD